MDRELRNDLIAGALMALVFVGVYFIWVNSPTFHQEQADQRQHAVEFLRQHQWDMLPSDIEAVMKAYGIKPEDIAPINLMP